MRDPYTWRTDGHLCGSSGSGGCLGCPRPPANRRGADGGGRSVEASRKPPAVPTDATIAASLRGIYADLAERRHLIVDELASQYFPNKPENIVSLAISLALVTQSAEKVALLAANIGGDSDSVASIGGAIAGALHPETLNREWFEVVDRINGHALIETATSLASLRPR